MYGVHRIGGIRCSTCMGQLERWDVVLLIYQVHRRCGYRQFMCIGLTGKVRPHVSRVEGQREDDGRVTCRWRVA